MARKAFGKGYRLTGPVEAYVLIAVKKDIPRVMRDINNIYGDKYINRMALVFGGADIIAKVKMASMEELLSFILNIIEKIEQVASARTFIIDKAQDN